MYSSFRLIFYIIAQEKPIRNENVASVGAIINRPPVRLFPQPKRAVNNRPYPRAVDNRPYPRAVDNRPYREPGDSGSLFSRIFGKAIERSRKI